MPVPVRLVICWSIIVLASLVALAQDRIPDILARAGRSLSASAPAPSGYASDDHSITPLLEVTDVIVRGRLEQPRSYLADNDTKVHTEYAIANPQYLFTATLSKPDLPKATHVSMMGGSVTINGLTYRSTYEALPLPDPGSECLLLLRYSSNRYYVAGIFYGILGIKDELLQPMSRDAAYVEEFRDAHAAKGIADIVARRIQLGQ